MLKLRFGNRVINLFKTMTGAERPGHKYCKRERLADGSGWKYFYPGSSGKCGGTDERSEELTHAKARRRHPEDYDATRPRFNASKQEIELINFSSYANSKDKLFGSEKKPRDFQQQVDHLKKLYSGNQASSAEGLFNEYMHSFAKEIGDHKIYDIDDLIRFADVTIKRFGSQNDSYSKEMVQHSLELLANIKALNDLPQDTVGGAARLERLWGNANNFWNETKAQIAKSYGTDFNYDNVRIRHAGKDVGSDRRADLFTEVYNETSGLWEADKFAISLKVNTGRPISWLEGTPTSSIINIFKDLGSSSMKEMGASLGAIYKNLNNRFDSKKYPKLSEDQLNREVMHRFKYEMYKKFGMGKTIGTDKRTDVEKDLLTAFAELAMKQTIALHHDPKTENLAISMMSIDAKTGAADYIGCSANALKKEWEKMFNSGPVSVEWGKTGNAFISVTGEKIPVIGDIKFIAGPPDKRFVFALIEGRHSRKSVQWRGPVKEQLEMMKKASKHDSGFGYFKERIQKAADKIKNPIKKSERIEVILEKATQTTERKKMNAKYIRKELTESGRVRYIYRETNPRSKRADGPEPVRRNQFLSLVDATDPEYKTLFNDSISEIDDAHFTSINAGCSSVRIAKDVETFLDTLGVPPELKNKEEFTSASGSFNVNKGKMAFCTSNFPEDVSEIMKKAVMMHEVGHGFFYGTLRIKHKKPLTADAVDSKDKDQKMLVKNAIKFVDTFGKMDEEIRKKAEFDVEGIKGQDKETLMQESIKTYMVSEYATLSSEEHFAEAFSRYFIMPEQLKKKEKEVYDHFEAYFQKYGG